MTRDELRAALQHPNVRAFLRVIREGESSQTDDAYRMMYGGGFFSSFADHPRQKVTAHGITSSAAGAYQFLEKTWDGLVAKYQFPDFSPECQDEAAVALIAGRGALQDLLRGDLSEVLDKCSWEWASLPPSRYGQSAMDGRKVYSTFQKWLAPSVSSPVEPSPESPAMPIPAIIGAAANVLLPIVADLFRGHGGATATRNADIIERAGPTIIEIAKTVTGTQTAEQAVEAIQNDPAQQQAFRRAVELDIDKLVGMIERITRVDDDSRDKAAVRASKEAKDMAPTLARDQFWLVVGAGAFLAIIAGLDMWNDGAMSEGILALVSMVIGWSLQKRGTIIDYRFGSSASSQLKDEVIAASKK